MVDGGARGDVWVDETAIEMRRGPKMCSFIYVF